jgi:hypothetical protein
VSHLSLAEHDPIAYCRSSSMSSTRIPAISLVTVMDGDDGRVCRV